MDFNALSQLIDLNVAIKVFKRQNYFVPKFSFVNVYVINYIIDLFHLYNPAFDNILSLCTMFYYKLAMMRYVIRTWPTRSAVAGKSDAGNIRTKFNFHQVGFLYIMVYFVQCVDVRTRLNQNVYSEYDDVLTYYTFLI